MDQNMPRKRAGGIQDLGVAGEALERSPAGLRGPGFKDHEELGARTMGAPLGGAGSGGSFPLGGDGHELDALLVCLHLQLGWVCPTLETEDRNSGGFDNTTTSGL